MECTKLVQIERFSDFKFFTLIDIPVSSAVLAYTTRGLQYYVVYIPGTVVKLQQYKKFRSTTSRLPEVFTFDFEV